MGTNPLLTKFDNVVFFDSNCFLCNKTVQFLLKIDKKKALSFVGLSSKLGHKVMKEYVVDADSVVYYNKEKVSTKSDAFIQIFRTLRFPYSILIVLYIIPKFIRDWVYDMIAKNRFQWFGKTEGCLLNIKDYSDRITL